MTALPEAASFAEALISMLRVNGTDALTVENVAQRRQQTLASGPIRSFTPAAGIMMILKSCRYATDLIGQMRLLDSDGR